MKKHLYILFFTLSLSWTSTAQNDGPLGDLFMAKDGGLVHYSSADPTGINEDRRLIEPGEELVLAEEYGSTGLH